MIIDQISMKIRSDKCDNEIRMIFLLKSMIMTNERTVQRATSQYKQAGEWDKAADTLATMADIYRKQVV